MLCEAGAADRAAALAERAAAHATLHNLEAVVLLLGALHEAGAADHAAALAGRAAAHAPLDDLMGVARLLSALRRAGAAEQAKVLIGRLPAEGRFDFFREQSGNEVRYRFGCEADGSPAPSWGWDDLD